MRPFHFFFTSGHGADPLVAEINVPAAGWAIGSAAYHAPEAVGDYAKDNLTVNPSEIDWDRTLKPWKWF
jgi:hypothetical protein